MSKKNFGTNEFGYNLLLRYAGNLGAMVGANYMGIDRSESKLIANDSNKQSELKEIYFDEWIWVEPSTWGIQATWGTLRGSTLWVLVLGIRILTQKLILTQIIIFYRADINVKCLVCLFVCLLVRFLH